MNFKIATLFLGEQKEEFHWYSDAAANSDTRARMYNWGEEFLKLALLLKLVSYEKIDGHLLAECHYYERFQSFLILRLVFNIKTHMF